jgi:hypothetical protein
MPYYLRHIAVASALLAWAACAAAQSFEAVGTRAAGMGGAFVAVADDASAAYWNPAGFASGNFFSIVLDCNTSKSDPAAPEGTRKGSGLLFAMGMPALGLSYYQLRSTVLADLKVSATGAAGLKASATGAAGLKASTTGSPTDGLRASRKAVGTGQVRLDTLVTHHTGATLLQSIGTGLAVGGTVKLVRGIASSDVVPDGARETLLARASELGGKGTTRFDADVGVMLSGPLVKAGLTIRNLTNPEFATPEGGALRLPRQARAGIAVALIEGWVVDADLDLTRTEGPLGAVREFAAGTEGRVNRKTFARGGLRVNTTGESATAVAGGASYMIVRSLLLDAQVTGGTSRADRGWGISARFVY